MNHRNVLGARTLSASGRQLFMIDKFRGTSQPLLSVLADKNSVFYKGLARFSNKVLYANIVNDRSTCFYTAGISRYDPFTDLSAITVNYLPNYSPIVLDPENPVSAATPKDERLPVTHRIGQSGKNVVKLPVILIYAIVVPLGTMVFLVNAVLQTILSSRRIRLHYNEGMCGYNALPLLAEEIQEAADQVFGEMRHEFGAQNLPSGSEEQSSGSQSCSDDDDMHLTDSMVGTENCGGSGGSAESTKTNTDTDAPSRKTMEFPTLALAPAQFKIINNLDSLGFRKFPVWVHNDKHSHAAIIVRKPREQGGDEGKVVVSHWLNEAFVV
jgi:hypothetical protein